MKNILFTIVLFSSFFSKIEANVDNCLPCAYNAPFITQNNCAWNVFAQGNYLYWEAKEENLELGSIETTDSTDFIFPIERIGVDFKYKSAFKVGLGFEFLCDHWIISGEYTNYRSDVKTSINFRPMNLQPVFETDWFPEVGSSDLFSCDEVFSIWDLDLDLADFELSRTYYVGKCLVFRSLGGLRAAWIDQKYKLNCRNSEFPLLGNGTVIHQTKSRGIGPRLGLDMDWNLCGGFRLFLNGDVNLLFTEYTTDRVKSDVTNFSGDFSINYSVDNNPCFLRLQSGMTIGLGWGRSFYCDRFYFDAEVGYSVNVFKDQNMFHSFIPDLIFNTVNIINRGGDLYLHGLTVTARIDF